MNRKLLTVLTCGTLFMGMAACSSNEKTTTESKPKQEEKVQEKSKVQTIQKQQKDSYVVSEDELSKAAQSIGEIQNEQTINDMMIHMSLQKLTFNGNNLHVSGTRDVGRWQMTKENIQYLKNNLNVINNDERPKYESILNKWYDGEFESVVKDFEEIHYLRSGKKQSMEGSKLAKKTDSDEKEFILHFFGQEGLDIHNKEWKQGEL
ncbi:DUF6241 domain-containing protein [Bacillus cereus]|uniref:Lipoprotein n=2 Tax=Bacillus cereus group TaxID=86661 RepID=A0A9W5P2K5_BACCE|nr:MULTISPECIES: DUF6241 domain-containing protein [Bacillus cereus group]MEB8735203.1 DUF6241 domain-containing protein [Bacillus cereus]EEM49164.1 hypothetical protein bthur0005_8800 [Bacillus thuringiensis serovar pakistani str. T13001]EJR72043.1 hypothetical protein IK5_02941 [Bacillus cereus VD154]KIU70596.1 lipoprotein [Bacillus thuringiensis Sbt003]MEB8748759.1 DUF6241 domain-containing protein [Bacillus cereus]